MADKDFIVKNGLVTGSNNATFGNSVYIASNGNIGVANSTPADKLVVAGNITATGNVGAASVNASSGFYGTVQTATQGTIDHNSLANYSSDRHIAHSGVSVSAGSGLTGGGDITSSRTISANPGNTQLIANSSGLWANQAAFDHNSLTNYVGNRHIDHSGVSISAGNGLSGGGDITSTRTLAVTAGTGVVVNTTGVHVNSTYIGTISANNTTYVNGKTEGNLNVSSASYATSAGGASGSSFGTATTGSEGQLVANFSGQNGAYLYNNGSAWGLYSASGGSMIYYRRSDGRVILNGVDIGASGSVNATYATNAGTITSTLPELGYARSGANVSYNGVGGPRIRGSGGGVGMITFDNNDGYYYNFGMDGGWLRLGASGLVTYKVVLESGTSTSWIISINGSANTANYATSANSAMNAGYATNAGYASNAGYANFSGTRLSRSVSTSSTNDTIAGISSSAKNLIISYYDICFTSSTFPVLYFANVYGNNGSYLCVADAYNNTPDANFYTSGILIGEGNYSNAYGFYGQLIINLMDVSAGTYIYSCMGWGYVLNAAKTNRASLTHTFSNITTSGPIERATMSSNNGTYNFSRGLWSLTYL